MKPNTQPPVDSKDEELQRLLGKYPLDELQHWQYEQLIEDIKQYGIQERIDEVRIFREAMTFSHTTPSIYEPNRIAELKCKQEKK